MASLLGSDITPSQLLDAFLWKLTYNDGETESQRWAEGHTIAELCSLQKKITAASVALRVISATFCPINRLPPEILAVIFSMVQPCLPDYRLHPINVDTSGWMAVAHVCHYWREIALTTSSLWSRIYPRNLDNGAVLAFLDRSVVAPLDVYLDCDLMPNDKGILPALASNCHRFRQFHVFSHYPFPEIAQMWRSFLTPGPMLESLCVWMQDCEEVDPTLPPLFLGQTPRLKKLALYHYSSWPDNCFVNLTHISLHNQSDSNRYSFTQFLYFLRASPHLEELVLIRAGPQMDDILATAAQAREPVVLNYLRVLEIGNWPSAHVVTQFLAHLIIPCGVELRIWGHTIFNADTLISSLFPPDSPQLDVTRRITKGCIIDNGHVQPLIVVKESTFHIIGAFKPSQYLPLLQTCFVDQLKEFWLSLDGHYSVAPTIGEYRTLFRSSSFTTLVIGGMKVELQNLLFALGNVGGEEVLNILPKLSELHIYDNKACFSLQILSFVKKRSIQMRLLRLQNCEERAMGHLRDLVDRFELGGTWNARQEVYEEFWPTPGFRW